MNFEAGFLKSENIDKKEKLKKECEYLLWQGVEMIATLLNEIIKESNILYEEINNENQKKSGLHQIQKIRELENKYWEKQREIENIKLEEQNVEQLLEDLHLGEISAEGVEKIISELTEDQDDDISKRKRYIMKERARYGDVIDLDYGPGGKPQVAHPSTGRNLKRVKMNTDSFNAVGEFFHSTADTHGGKVSAGKHGNIYASKSGKMIRKK